MALLAANAVLALMILLSGWGYYQAVMVLWLEILIVGLYNVAGIYVVALFGNPFGRWAGFDSKASALLWTTCGVGFFLLKFGGFLLAPGILVLMAPALLAENGDGGAMMFEALTNSLAAIGVCTAALFLAHGVWFAVDFIGRREYERAGVLSLLFAPYLRAFSLFFTLVLAFAVTAAQPIVSRQTGFAVALVGIKVGGDLLGHAWVQRRRASRRDFEGLVTDAAV
jgi:hypothetical protein